jgi:hypothetical protein
LLKGGFSKQGWIAIFHLAFSAALMPRIWQNGKNNWKTTVDSNFVFTYYCRNKLFKPVIKKVTRLVPYCHFLKAPIPPFKDFSWILDHRFLSPGEQHRERL